MQFDLFQFITRAAQPAERTFTLEVGEGWFSGYSIAEPVQVHFTVQHEGTSRVKLAMWFDVQTNAECARCLEPVTNTYQIRQEYMMSLEELQSDMCDLPVSGRGMLDVNQLALSEISLQVPQVVLCSEDCQGLCPVCGSPRKLGCGCVEQSADERLSIFDQLLS